MLNRSLSQNLFGKSGRVVNTSCSLNQHKFWLLRILMAGYLATAIIATVVSFRSNNFKPTVLPTSLRGLAVATGIIISLLIVCSFVFKKYYLIAVSFSLVVLLSLYISTLQWGLAPSYSLLLYGISVIFSGMLFSSKLALITTLLHSSYLVLIKMFELEGLLKSGLDLQADKLGSLEFALIIALLGLACTVTWLYNLQLKATLKRALLSEEKLKKQRNLLDQKVQQKTSQLKQAQLKKAAQLYKFVEFGKLASGLFHQMSQPVTAMLINFNHFKQIKTADPEVIKLFECGLNKTRQFLQAAQKQLQSQTITYKFCPIAEIDQTLLLIKPRIESLNICLSINQIGKNRQLLGNPLAFDQFMTILISNAVDALETSEKKQKKIDINFNFQKQLLVTVADNADGIAQKHHNNIFKPLFTTKSCQRGTGIGLYLCQDIIKKQFKGKINFETSSAGTKFLVTLPYRSPTGS